MATTVSSISLKGIEGYRVQVKVQFRPGVEGVSIVGLPDVPVKESKKRKRVMAAMYANGCVVAFMQRTIINGSYGLFGR